METPPQSRHSQNRPRPKSRRPSPARRSKPFQALPGPRRRTGEGFSAFKHRAQVVSMIRSDRVCAALTYRNAVSREWLVASYPLSRAASKVLI